MPTSTVGLRNWSWPLLTDLYELTMALGYWQHGLDQRRAAFHLTYRENPFGGQLALACGLADVCAILDDYRFSASDIDYLAGLRGANERRLFPPDFLDHLAALSFACDIDAIPEGTVVQPHEPLVRVTGPLLQAQLIESVLLNVINSQTLIATKSARICVAANGRPVLEFGLRRAQGVDGAMAASRAAYIGGCAATSNVLAGKMLGIPVRGTHAHSWVLCFDDEQSAFRAFAESQPGNCIFLVDTVATLPGIRNAIAVAQQMRDGGNHAVGIRLDSGDFLDFSRQARRLLDEAGLADMKIVASNDLDEHEIARLVAAGAPIDIFGVGTRLVTAYDQPALGGIYKLTALADRNGEWRDRVKVSDEAIKISTPGVLQVRRWFRDDAPAGDIVYDIHLGEPAEPTLCQADGQTVRLSSVNRHVDLLTPIYRGGQRVTAVPDVHAIRRHGQAQLALFSRWLTVDHASPAYAVGLEPQLFARRHQLIETARIRHVQP